VGEALTDPLGGSARATGVMPTHFLTHGILIESADGFQAINGHIINCKNDLTISPDNTDSQDVCGGILFENVYFDRSAEYGVLIEGTAKSFGRMYFNGCRASSAGIDGYHIAPATPIAPAQKLTIFRSMEDVSSAERLG
jgi:hypothetical protein